MSESDCVFCGIVRGESEAEVVHDEEEVMAFHSINGHAPVHVLVVPKRHVGSLEEIGGLTEEATRRLLQVCSEVAEKTGIGKSGYAVRINNGPDAGQEIFHLHLHVMGGKELGMP